MDAGKTERASEAALGEILLAFRESAAPQAAGPADTHLFATHCVLCSLVDRSVERTLRAVLGEYVNDPETRLLLRRAQGYCRLHGRLLAEYGDPLAVAVLYADLARLTRERWQQRTPRGVRGFLFSSLSLQRGRSAPSPCPACIQAREAERRYTEALAAGLLDRETWHALEHGGALCIAHVESVMERAAPEAALRLRNMEMERLTALQAELEEIIRKNDYRFRDEPWGAEKHAWLRALEKLARPRDRRESP